MIIKGQDVDNIYLRRHAHRRRLPHQALRLPAVQPAVRGGVEDPAEDGHRRARAARLRRPIRPRPAACVGRLDAVPAALDLQDAAREEGEGGSRLAIVLNGSPLFTGGAGSGESNIRRWIIENDLLDAIVALPTDMFYNTGISTYIWILDNNKPAKRKGKIQLINAVEMFGKMRKSLGSKRKELRPKDIERICHLYDSFRNEHGTDEHPALSKVFKGKEFGYSTITVERPLQLRFEPTEDKVEEVLAQKSIEKLKPGEQAAIRNALTGLIGWEWKDRDEFVTELKDALRKAGYANRLPRW